MYVTASSMDEANDIAEGLIMKDLAACVNIIPQVKSVYKWEGAVESSDEILLMIKVSINIIGTFVAIIVDYLYDYFRLAKD